MYLKEHLADFFVIDLDRPVLLANTILKICPDEIYHLAAHHFSSQSEKNRTEAFLPFNLINVLAVDEALQVMMADLQTTKYFYASSCQIFGVPTVFPQTESTPYNPDTPYSISKCTGFYLCRYYRSMYNIHASVGILYNHESPRRGMSFVSSQIARAAAKAYYGKCEPLLIKNLDAIVDWGAAEDYVRAMWLTLQQKNGDEYIIASGVPHTVRDFAKEAFGYLGLNWEKYVFQDKNRISSTRLPYIGNSSKIRNICGWEPVISFEQLIKSMVDYQLLNIQSENVN